VGSPKEIEIKSRVDDMRKLTRRLRISGFRLVTRRTHERNTIYDLPGLPLRNRGEVAAVAKIWHAMDPYP
jgi:adenylate cyclase class IV